MSKLAVNFDLVAIIVLALLLGVAQTPRFRSRIIRLEQRPTGVRTLKIDRLVYQMPNLGWRSCA